MSLRATFTVPSGSKEETTNGPVPMGALSKSVVLSRSRIASSGLARSFFSVGEISGVVIVRVVSSTAAMV